MTKSNELYLLNLTSFTCFVSPKSIWILLLIKLYTARVLLRRIDRQWLILKDIIPIHLIDILRPPHVTQNQLTATPSSARISDALNIEEVVWFTVAMHEYYDSLMICYVMIRYDMIRYDMIWYDMKWDDVIWYDDDMRWYDTIWYDMMWYDMIWYDMMMIWDDMIWYDTIWYDMIWSEMIW